MCASMAKRPRKLTCPPTLVYLDPALVDALDAIARAEARSRSDLIRELLWECVGARDRGELAALRVTLAAVTGEVGHG